MRLNLYDMKGWEIELGDRVQVWDRGRTYIGRLEWCTETRQPMVRVEKLQLNGSGIWQPTFGRAQPFERLPIRKKLFSRRLKDVRILSARQDPERVAQSVPLPPPLQGGLKPGTVTAQDEKRPESLKLNRREMRRMQKEGRVTISRIAGIAGARI